MKAFVYIFLLTFVLILANPVDAQRKSANYQIVDDSVAGVSIGEGVENFQMQSSQADQDAREMTRSDYSFFIFLAGLLVIISLIIFISYRKKIKLSA